MNIDIPFDKSTTVSKPLADCHAFLSDYKTNIPKCFPGLKNFIAVNETEYHWEFNTLTIKGINLHITFNTNFELTPTVITFKPKPGKTQVSGKWTLTEKAGECLLRYECRFETSINIPFLFKSLAQSLAQTEITKLCETYFNNVIKNITK